MRFIKRVFLKMGIGIFRGFSLLGKGFGWLSRALQWPFAFAARKIGRFILLPVYKVFWFMKRRFSAFFSPTRRTVMGLLTKKYIVHLLIASLTLFVYVGNINAQETREEGYGEDTIMYAMFNGVSEEILVEESAGTLVPDRILNYQSELGIVSEGLSPQDLATAEQELVDSIASTTGTGTAITKTNIADSTIFSAPRLEVVTHTVNEGETISTIAEKYGISVPTILWANSLTAKSVIKPGTGLRILPVTGVEYKVKKGESLQSIARKYKVDTDKILAVNGMGEDDTLSVGQVMLLPDAEQIVPVIAAKPRPIVSRETTPAISGVFKAPDVSGTSDLKEGKGGMVWPTDWHVITQYYGFRHTGVDLDGDYNSHIYAADAGIIEVVGWNNGGYGNRIIIDHGNGIKTLYAHMQTFSVKKGQYVGKGDTLGMMGSTGRSTGTHLHFEVRINGSFRNPLQYVK